MKRSRRVSLVVMGTAPLLLGACDHTQKSQQAFTSIDSCSQANIPMSVCQGAFRTAKLEETKLAPHYALFNDCTAVYDDNDCDQQTDSQGVVYWRPSMSGVLIARVIRNGQTSYYPAGPIFHKRDASDYSPRYGTLYAGGGSGASAGPGYTGGDGNWRSVPPDEVAGEGDTSRGGFGGAEGGDGSEGG